MSKLLNYLFSLIREEIYFLKASEYKDDGESNYYLVFSFSTTRETGKKNVRPAPGSVTFCFSVVFLTRRKWQKMLKCLSSQTLL